MGSKSSKSVTAADIEQRVRSLGNPKMAAQAQRFFKTGPGEYGEGDVFVGVRVPTLRKLAGECRALPLAETEKLLHSEIHEARLVALVIWVLQAARADARTRAAIYKLYLANSDHVNNWDLVDVSAPHLVGAHLADRSRQPLYRLAKSQSLWQRRIGIVATHHMIRQRDYADTLAIAEILLADREDLIHKATGWMLREVGKRDLVLLDAFLAQHHRAMPRTMLRYAIERHSPAKRREYLKTDEL